MSASDKHAGVVTCPICELHLQVAEPNEAIEIYRRHRSVTNHEIGWERTALGVTVASTDTESALEALDDEYSDGVPVGVLSAALSAQGVSISEVLDDIYSLRMDGIVYEPRDDHFRPF